MLQVQFKTAQGVRVGLMDLIPFGLLQQLFYAAALLTHYCSPPKTDQSTCAVVQTFNPFICCSLLCFIWKYRNLNSFILPESNYDGKQSRVDFSRQTDLGETRSAGRGGLSLRGCTLPCRMGWRVEQDHLKINNTTGSNSHLRSIDLLRLMNI